MPDTPLSLFISYAHADSAFVDQLEADLQKQGFETWVDRQRLAGGQRWRRELQEAVEQAQVLILVLSPDAIASQSVQIEFDYALDLGKLLIPVYYRQCNVPMELRAIQWIDFRHSYEQGLTALVQALRRQQDQVPPPASSPLASTSVQGVPPSQQQASQSEVERPWNVPFTRNPFFTGRGQLLERLHAQLSRSHSAALTQSYALSGLGGIGKTQTAIEYAYRYAEEYSAVFWVRADSREILVADYVAIAHLLGLPGQDASDQLLIVTAVKRWLEQQKGWLLILDNADELSLLSDFLPIKSQGHVLLTTRAQATGKIAQSLSVERMGMSEGIQLLLRRAKLLDPQEPLDTVAAIVRTAAQQLVTELDGLPLALDQVGAYIEETGCSVSEYLQLYVQHRLALLQQQSSMSTDYPHTVASTWALSFAQVEQQSPAAADLLRLCAFLHPDAIPEAMVAEGATELGPALSPVAADPLLLNGAIQLLRRYSLVKRDADAKVLNIHRLVQVVLKESLNQAMQREWAERCVRAVNHAFPEAEFAFWERCELCLPHALLCAQLIEEQHFSFSEAARLLHMAGVYLRDRGQYPQAEPLLARALALREQVLGPEHSEAVNTLNELAWLYVLQGNYQQAQRLLQPALARFERVLGKEHPEVAFTLEVLATAYVYAGNYTQAEPLLQRSLALREQVLGPEHSEAVNTLNLLAWLYVLQGNYQQAQRLLQPALARFERVLGKEHPAVATALDTLAGAYTYEGKYAQAEPLYQRALALHEQVLGTSHPDVADSLHNLAFLYVLQGQYAQAELLYQRALALSEHTRGSEHPHTLITFSHLARLCMLQGKYTQAEPLLQRALATKERVQGLEHPYTALDLSNLGRLYTLQGKYAQAEPLLQRALALLERLVGPVHRFTLETLRYLADLAQALGQDERAESLYQQALASYEQVLGPEHPFVAETLTSLAQLYTRQGHYRQAEPLLARALVIDEHALGPEQPQTATVLDTQGYLALLQGREEQAEPLLQRALAIQEQALGNTHPEVAHTLHHLAQLSEKQGKREQARSLYQQALSIWEHTLGPDHPDTIATRDALTRLLQLLHAQEQEGLTSRRKGVPPA